MSDVTKSTSKKPAPVTTGPVTEPATTTEATTVPTVFEFNNGAARKSLSMVIFFMLERFNPEEFFGVQFDPAITDYFKKEALDRATRILGKRPAEAIKAPIDILEMALVLRPNAGGGRSERSETATKRAEFKTALRKLTTVDAIDTLAATWPGMPETLSEEVAHRRGIVKRAMERAANKEAENAAKATATEGESSTRKAKPAAAKAPAPVATAPATTKRPVVAKIDEEAA